MTDASERRYPVELSAQRLEYILNTLGQRPYFEVYALIEDIRGQLAAQAEPPESGAQLKAV